MIFNTHLNSVDDVIFEFRIKITIFQIHKNYMLISRFFFSKISDTAYGKNKDDGRWYHFDDSSVTPISENAVVVSETLYILSRNLQFWRAIEDE